MQKLLALTLALTLCASAAMAQTTTTTLERTTTRTYTITKQKVGMVGGRPFPVKKITSDGGVTVEKFVNDVKTDTQIVQPDPMLDANAPTNAQPYDYYTDAKGSKMTTLNKPLSNVRVHNSGNLNR